MSIPVVLVREEMILAKLRAMKLLRGTWRRKISVHIWRTFDSYAEPTTELFRCSGPGEGRDPERQQIHPPLLSIADILYSAALVVGVPLSSLPLVRLPFIDSVDMALCRLRLDLLTVVNQVYSNTQAYCPANMVFLPAHSCIATVTPGSVDIPGAAEICRMKPCFVSTKMRNGEDGWRRLANLFVIFQSRVRKKLTRI